MGNGVVWVEPIDVTPGSTGWQDVDLDTHIASLGGDVTGAILHIYKGSSATTVGWRKNGSTDERTGTLSGTCHFGVMIGVDANRIFEINLASVSNVAIYLTGYTKGGFVFFDNGYDKSISDTSNWTDVDCGDECPSATGVLLEIHTTGNTNQSGWRQNGSTDERLVRTSYKNGGVVAVGVDANQICEVRINNTSVDHFLIGYFNSNSGVTMYENATDKSLGSTGAYADLAALPDGSTGGIIEVYGGGLGTSYALRKNGSSFDVYTAAMNHCCRYVECDGSELIEGEISTTDIDFFLTGYTAAAPDTSSWGGTWGG